MNYLIFVRLSSVTYKMCIANTIYLLVIVQGLKMIMQVKNLPQFLA